MRLTVKNGIKSGKGEVVLFIYRIINNSTVSISTTFFFIEAFIEMAYN